jgi:choline dehydrogenase
VLLIEAGRKDDYHWIHIPVGYLYCIGNPRTDWLYNTEPDAGLNGRTLRYPRGKTLGGCSSINGMIYMRGQARDYDHWAQLTGDETWSWRQHAALVQAARGPLQGRQRRARRQGHALRVAGNAW